MFRRGGKILVNILKFVLSQEHFMFMDNPFEKFACYLTLISEILQVKSSIDVLPLVCQLLSYEILKLGLLVLRKN
jgi:hypothetical protein